MKKIAHLVKNPCQYDWRVIKAAQAGKSSSSEVVIFAAAMMNINQHEVYDDIKLLDVTQNLIIFRHKEIGGFGRKNTYLVTCLR